MVALTRRQSAAFDRVVRAVLESPGVTSPDVRAAVADGDDVPDELAIYVAKVRTASYRVTDADIAALREAGHGERAIFELTVAAALGAAQHTFEMGLRALHGQR